MHRGLRIGGLVALGFALVLLAVVVVRTNATPPAATASPIVTTTTVAPTTTAPTTTTTTTPPETAPPETTIPPPPVPHPGPPRFPTRVGTAVKPSVAIYDGPGYGLRQSLASPVAFSNMPLNFEIIDDPGNGYLHVKLRTRPNGSTGYIKKTDVGVTTHNWSIDIDLAAHWLTVYDGANVWLQTSAVTGTEYTPTPLGDFFTTEGVWEANPNGSYGPYVFGLSAHSDVWMQFGGGDGQVGIHGTNMPQLLGTSSSNGCIRIPNEHITRMAKSLPMGVPVHIHNG